MLTILDLEQNIYNKILLLLSLFLFQVSSFARDSTTSTVPSVTASSSTGGCSSYYFLDAYNGTVQPGNTTPPQGTSITLQFYNNGSPSTKTPILGCAGKYKIIFSLELQSNNNVASITITPTVTSVLGVTFFPPASGPTSFTIYPQCNNSSYSSTPYCSVSIISGSGMATVTAADQISAPVFTAGSSVTVLGGQFVAYLCPTSGSC